MEDSESSLLRFAEIMGALGHLVEHGPDLLPFCIQLLELGRGNVTAIDRVI